MESLKHEALAHMQLLVEENVLRRIEEYDEPLMTKARRRRSSPAQTTIEEQIEEPHRQLADRK